MTWFDSHSALDQFKIRSGNSEGSSLKFSGVDGSG